MDNFYQRFNAPNKGYCRLCGKYDKLTNEHIPPKSCFNDQDYYLTNNPEVDAKIHAKGGIKFKAICRICNNDVVSQLDEELGRLIKDVENFINVPKLFGILLRDYKVKFNKTRVLQCILAKLLASYFPLAEVSRKLDDWDYEYTNFLRNSYKLDPMFLQQLRLYYWINTSPFLAIVPGLSIAGEMGDPESVVVSSFLKFYPMSFWLMKANDNLQINLPYLEFKNNDEDQNVLINLKFTPKEKDLFPLTSPTKEGFYLFNSTNSIFAFPNKEQKIYIKNKIII